jgi:hypothetical protein
VVATVRWICVNLLDLRAIRAAVLSTVIPFQPKFLEETAARVPSVGLAVVRSGRALASDRVPVSGAGPQMASVPDHLKIGNIRKALVTAALARSTKNEPARVMVRNAFAEGP